MNGSKRTWCLLAVSLVLILIGDLLASCIQTDWGNIKVRDVRFMGSNGVEMSALLYIPKGATAKTPAPGIVAIHGYINSRETQDAFAIEFARRGFVVLASDQTGHGYSDPP
ncbi:MAG: alpha/beta hydrolase, partial [Syntrophales bacterium]|nr:alpha/beta hydrolase [Syntrophales bacterium]